MHYDPDIIDLAANQKGEITGSFSYSLKSSNSLHAFIFSRPQLKLHVFRSEVNLKEINTTSKSQSKRKNFHFKKKILSSSRGAFLFHLYPEVRVSRPA
ncbi:hypothetical protein CEXT_52621 [Caerostris extrusa]|uniref:Uncharacterized protein n=1 Tax=Caerostris extrusa TaxID=172846 RepID=A0AAV4NDK9_CAEEX|nr:hypothetical protein CEXT_52621 [Caerostris extrusa]